jgi:serine/threonine-protein kinase
MAPEQIRGASKVDERADLYSFGTVVFEALTGRLAHDASGQMAMLASKLERPASRLADCALVPTPPELDALVARLLARDPAERLATAREVLGAWEALGPATVEPRAYAFDAATIAAPAGATQTSLTAGTGSILPSSRGSRLPLVVAAGAVAMSLGVFGAMLLARAPGDEGRAQAGEETARSSGAHAAPPTSAAAAVAEAPSLAGTATAPASAPAFGAPAGTASSGVAPAVSTDGDWITVAPATLDLTVDAGLSAAARPSRRRYGRPSAPATTKRGTGEPRIEDRPRY